jgi:hypothetical protein
MNVRVQKKMLVYLKLLVWKSLRGNLETQYFLMNIFAHIY